MKKNHFMWSWALVSILLFGSCKDEIIVGSDLLTDQIIMVDVTDQVGLQSKTELSDPFITFDSLLLDRRSVFVGQIQDDIFGNLTPELALSFNLIPNNPPAFPIGTKPLSADSIVLALTFDTLATYGDLNAVFRVEVTELNNRIPSGREIKSDLQVVLGNVLADTMIQIKPKDSVKLVNPVDGKTIKQLPQLRIRLSQELAAKILLDPLSANKDSAFVELLKGIHLKATPMNKGGVFGFNLSSQALASTVSNRLILYYTESDTIKKSYNYTINRRFVNLSKVDYTGSLVEKHVLDTTLSDQVSYLQGFGGPKVKISLMDLTSLKDKIINFAQLVVTAENTSGNPPTLASANQLFALKKNSSGEFVFIDDILPISFANLIAVFGGTKVVTAGKTVYTMNITNQLKAFLKNPSLDRSIYLTVPDPAENISRSVIYGAKHPQFKMKLKVNFTNK